MSAIFSICVLLTDAIYILAIDQQISEFSVFSWQFKIAIFRCETTLLWVCLHILFVPQIFVYLGP